MADKPTNSGEAFVAIGAQPNPETGKIGPDEIKQAKRSKRLAEVFIALDKDFNVVSVGEYDKPGTYFNKDDAAKAEFLLHAKADPTDGTARLNSFKLKGRDGKFFDDTWSGNGSYDRPADVPMDQNGFVDFKNPQVRAKLTHSFLPLFNIRTDQPMPETPVPDRWKTGLQHPPAVPIAVGHDPAGQVDPAAIQKSVERLQAGLRPIAEPGTSQAEIVLGWTPPGNPGLIAPKGKGKAP